MSTDPKPADPVITTKPKPDQTKPRRVPPYNVILENDDYHSMEFVIDVLRKVVGCSEERAFQLMHQAHSSGRAIIWTGSKEVAELKYEQMCSFTEIRDPGHVKLGPLSCLIEPAV